VRSGGKRSAPGRGVALLCGDQTGMLPGPPAAATSRPAQGTLRSRPLSGFHLLNGQQRFDGGFCSGVAVDLVRCDDAVEAGASFLVIHPDPRRIVSEIPCIRLKRHVLVLPLTGGPEDLQASQHEGVGPVCDLGIELDLAICNFFGMWVSRRRLKKRSASMRADASQLALPG